MHRLITSVFLRLRSSAQLSKIRRRRPDGVSKTDSQIELSPRAFLGCDNKARSLGIALKDLVNSIVLQWLERGAEAQVEERIAREAREERAKVGLRWKDWRERKPGREMEALHRKFREIEKEYRSRECRVKPGKEESGNGN